QSLIKSGWILIQRNRLHEIDGSFKYNTIGTLFGSQRSMVMKIKPLSLQQNKLMHHYRNQHADILEHFDYNPYKDDIYENRLKELNKRTFDRERLVEALMRMNEEWNV